MPSGMRGSGQADAARPLAADRGWPQRLSGAREGPRQRAADGRVIRIFLADAVAAHFALFARDIQRAERPIPYRQREAEVLVEMLGIGGMVDLMVRRALEQFPRQPLGRNPEMAVAQMAPGQHEDRQRDIAVQQSD